MIAMGPGRDDAPKRPGPVETWRVMTWRERLVFVAAAAAFGWFVFYLASTLATLLEG